MLKIFKKEEITLADLDIETASNEQIQNACKSSTWAEIQNRINSLSINLRKLPPAKLDETPEERAVRARKINEKLNLLRECLNEKEKEEKKLRDQEDIAFSERTALEEVRKRNLRYSFEPLVRTLQHNGFTAIPPNAIKWVTPTSTIIEIQCQSGRIRKMDLTKLPSAWWKQLISSPFTPIFIVAENAGTQRTKNTLEPLWIEKQTFHGEDKIIAIPTIIAIMIV